MSTNPPSTFLFCPCWLNTLKILKYPTFPLFLLAHMSQELQFYMRVSYFHLPQGLLFHTQALLRPALNILETIRPTVLQFEEDVHPLLRHPLRWSLSLVSRQRGAAPPCQGEEPFLQAWKLGGRSLCFSILRDMVPRPHPNLRFPPLHDQGLTSHRRPAKAVLPASFAALSPSQGELMPPAPLWLLVIKQIPGGLLVFTVCPE